MKKISKLALAVLPFLAAPMMASAEYIPERKMRLYASGPTGSYHYEHKGGFDFEHAEANEENWIWGFGIPFENVKLNLPLLGETNFKEIEAFAYRCINSEGHPSTAIGANFILGCTNTSVNVCGGFGWGGVDGYKGNNHKFALSKYPYPHVTLSYKKARLNTYISNVVVMYSFGLELEF